LEICRGSQTGATVDFKKLPIIPGVLELAAHGNVTGASGRNWAGYGHDVVLGSQLGDVERNLLTDPQTSGGLLVACGPEHVDDVLSIFRAEGFVHAAEIGEIVAGEAKAVFQ
jgi:selenide,water dikinase